MVRKEEAAGIQGNARRKSEKEEEVGDEEVKGLVLVLTTASFVRIVITLLHKTENGYEMTISDGCIEKTYQLSECFLENADINKDGVIDLNDKNALFLLIVEQSNK